MWQEAEDSDGETLSSHAGNNFIQLGQHHSKYKAGQVRNWRIFQGLKPLSITKAVDVSQAVGIVDDIEDPRHKADHPDEAHLCKVRTDAFRLFPPRHPGE